MRKMLAEEQESVDESSRRTQRQEKNIIEKVMGAIITRQIGKEIVRGLFGMLTGKKSRSRSSKNLFGF